MTIIDRNAQSARLAVTCPLCHSTECRSMRIGNPSVSEAAAEFLDLQSTRRLTPRLISVLGWAMVEIANGLRDAWQCDYCHHSFR